MCARQQTGFLTKSYIRFVCYGKFRQNSILLQGNGIFSGHVYLYAICTLLMRSFIPDPPAFSVYASS